MEADFQEHLQLRLKLGLESSANQLQKKLQVINQDMSDPQHMLVEIVRDTSGRRSPGIGICQYSFCFLKGNTTTTKDK